jgi:prepilin-type N-terminal cleavage/methylation domain-containing protein
MQRGHLQMLRKLTDIKKRNEGFTIVEVMIVLAIAGLILLIVFLAVPALQRNSRNTSIKNDAQNVLGGVAEFQNANNGEAPTAVAGTGTVSYTKTGKNTTTANVAGTTVVSTINAAPAAAPPNGTIQVRLGFTCGNTANSRAVAVYYSIETTGTPTVQQCTDS